MRQRSSGVINHTRRGKTIEDLSRLGRLRPYRAPMDKQIMENLPRIEALKLAAIEANLRRDTDALALILRELEGIWHDNRAACGFYAMLNETALDER